MPNHDLPELLRHAIADAIAVLMEMPDHPEVQAMRARARALESDLRTWESLDGNARSRLVNAVTTIGIEIPLLRRRSR